MKPLVYGVGLNDVAVRVSSQMAGRKLMHPIYDMWKGMLRRCYAGRPEFVTYVGCSVCDEWLTLSTFWSWVEPQPYLGMVLDKDILLPGNKVYGPSACLLVPKRINSLVVATNRDLPMGVYRAKGKYKVQTNFDRQTKYHGTFEDLAEASSVAAHARTMELRRVAASLDDKNIAHLLIKRGVA